MRTTAATPCYGFVRPYGFEDGEEAERDLRRRRTAITTPSTTAMATPRPRATQGHGVPAGVGVDVVPVGLKTTDSLTGAPETFRSPPGGTATIPEGPEIENPYDPLNS